jgi:hypothetical protein
MSEWKKFISLTHCTLIQHSHHLWLHIFSVLSICSLCPWRKFMNGCWSICTQLPQLRHWMQDDDLLMPSSILGTTRSLAVPNLGCKEAVELLWISGLWHTEFVHCNVALWWCDAKEMCFFLAWFCRCVVWVIIGLHNTCRNSPSIL